MEAGLLMSKTQVRCAMNFNTTQNSQLDVGDVLPLVEYFVTLTAVTDYLLVDFCHCKSRMELLILNDVIFSVCLNCLWFIEG